MECVGFIGLHIHIYIDIYRHMCIYIYKYEDASSFAGMRDCGFG